MVMWLYKESLWILCCLLPVVICQDSELNSDVAGLTNTDELFRSLFGSNEECQRAGCGHRAYPDEPEVQTESIDISTGEIILEPEYPVASTSSYPDIPSTGNDYEDDFARLSFCDELLIAIKEIESEYPEFAHSKYQLHERYKAYYPLFLSELRKSSSEDVTIRILDLLITFTNKVKTDFVKDMTGKGKYVKPKVHPVPTADDTATVEIIAEEEEMMHPYPSFVGSVRGVPGEDYPNYSEVPITSFSCADKKHIPGFYADMETGCQVFHVCYEHRRESFLCPVGTTFNQPILACDYWYSSNCSLSPLYFDVNAHKEPTKETEVESTIGALITTIIDGEKPVIPKVPIKDEKPKFDKKDLGELVKFLPVKATVVEFPEYTVPKIHKVPDAQTEEVASKIFDKIVTSTTHLASKTREVIKLIPDPEEKPSLVEAKLIKTAASIPLKAKVATKIVAAKAAAPVIAKAKLVAAAKVAAAVPIAKVVAAKAAIPVVAKAKLAAAVPVAKVVAAKAAVPVVAKAKLAAAVPVAKVVAAKAAAPIVAKAKLAAAVPIAKVVAAKVSAPVAAAKVAVPIAAKAKMVAAVPVAKVKAAKVAVPFVAKTKLAAAIPAKKAKIAVASVPIAKTKLWKAAAVPVKSKMFALPVAKKKFAAASVPVVKAKKLPLLALAGVKPKFAAVPLAKAKLVKSIAISPLTKKALALGYLKLLKAKKLALMG